MKDLPVRKNIRKIGYEYSRAGRYFITICVKDKHELLGKIDVGANCVRPQIPSNRPQIPSNRPQTPSNRPQTPSNRPHMSNIYTHLSDIGMIVEKEISVLSSVYNGVSVNKHMVMPNHIHMIIVITVDGQTQDGRMQDGRTQDGRTQDGRMQDGRTQDGQTQDGRTQDGRTQDGQTQDGRTQFAPTISRIIKQFKGAITKQIGYSIWQRSFHDHIIRNEAEYQQIWRYIDENPAKWKEDCYYPLQESRDS